MSGKVRVIDKGDGVTLLAGLGIADLPAECRAAAIKPPDSVTVATPRPSTRYRTLTAFEGLEGRTPTVTETPWRCSVVPSGAGASGVLRLRW